MRIGVYGGAFNPPHLGHITAARAVSGLLKLDKLLVIPTGHPPHKTLPPGGPTPEQRLEMTRLAMEQAGLKDRIEVLDLEIRREGNSYTADTLARLKEQYPEDELWLLMGADMFLTLQSWRQPERILSLAGIAAFGRTEADTGGLFDLQRDYLYRMYPQARLRPVALSCLDHRRIPHVLGTEQEAIHLAERWGADVDKARRAALLHDCTKKLSLPEQLAAAERFQVPLDGMERQELKLLHAKTGAGIAETVFGTDAEITNAIRWHTTGRAHMTLLEKVIYLADYIEPTRSFPGVEALRKACYEDLDAGLLLGLEMTIQEMEARGAPIHPKTLEARDALKGQR